MNKKKIWVFSIALLVAMTMIASVGLAELLQIADNLVYSPVASYESESLRYTVEEFECFGAKCFISRIWMQDPGKQIVKATAEWEESLALPSEMAEKLDCDPALVINGSGYVSRVFPWIPENYPGKNEDYFCTPLGSLTITNGKLFRNLNIPFYGLTLQADGLHMHVGDETAEVLAQDPTETWSFYVECPVILDGVSILDPDWRFTNTPAIRTIIAKLDDHQYVLLTVQSPGWKMADAVDYMLQKLHPVWAYDLDGGPSSALLVREKDEKELTALYGNRSKDADIMAFCELPVAK